MIYIPYQDVIEVFKTIQFDLAFHEDTPDKVYVEALMRLKSLTTSQKTELQEALVQISKHQIDEFMDKLRNCLERSVIRIVIIPLFGLKYEFKTIQDALNELESLDLHIPKGEFEKFEVLIDYSNTDTIRATFQDKGLLKSFLQSLGI